LPRVAELAAAGTRVVFVGNGSRDDLAAFVAAKDLARWPARFVTDPERAAYRAAGLPRGRHITPRAAWDELAAMAHGYLRKRRAGDAGQLGGAMLVAGGRVLYHHVARRPGDVADGNELVEAALAHLIASRAGACV
jgi:hypothetical protein